MNNLKYLYDSLNLYKKRKNRFKTAFILLSILTSFLVFITSLIAPIAIVYENIRTISDPTFDLMDVHYIYIAAITSMTSLLTSISSFFIIKKRYEIYSIRYKQLQKEAYLYFWSLLKYSDEEMSDFDKKYLLYKNISKIRNVKSTKDWKEI